MRGRKPLRVTIAPADYPVLQWLAHGEGVLRYQAQRARIVLAVADGGRTQDVARLTGCDAATVWRTCRRYLAAGLTGLLADGRRSGPAIPLPPHARPA